MARFRVALSQDITTLDFTGGETNFNSTWGLGTYAGYDATEREVSDAYYIYTTAWKLHRLYVGERNVHASEIC